MTVPQGISKTWRFDIGDSVGGGTCWGINNLAFDPERGRPQGASWGTPKRGTYATTAA
ncbi:hypothetical protein Q9S36_42285 [Microbacterium sp. ARD31]|uniref:hypothetical protein n=1 Tax=Microbacterium sp. ARD31 TaxID=2962576 RepID=UPI0028829B05|nr:hypothetical protein [Microbacterium sp. ARD31]MDT0186834.1 hypothetical protein [Microbacterium sp. ARD31]